jgi:hypothetical protein
MSCGWPTFMHCIWMRRWCECLNSSQYIQPMMWCRMQDLIAKRKVHSKAVNAVPTSPLPVSAMSVPGIVLESVQQICSRAALAQHRSRRLTPNMTPTTHDLTVWKYNFLLQLTFSPRYGGQTTTILPATLRRRQQSHQKQGHRVVLSPQASMIQHPLRY